MKTLPITSTQFLKACERYLGIGEHPPGSNRNEITRWFGVAAAWCMMSMCRVAYDLGILEALWGRKLSYTVDGYDRGKSKGWLVNPRGKYEPGDFVFFNFGDSDWGGRPLGIHHVGVCKVDLGGGKFASYEGNTGDDFKKRVRAKSLVAAVVRPPWKRPFFAPKAKGRFARIARRVLCHQDEAMRHKAKRWLSKKDLWAERGGEVRVEVFRGGKAAISGGFSHGKRVWVPGSAVGRTYVR